MARALAPLAVVLLASMLAACGSSETDEGGGAAASGGGKPGRPPAAPAADMVAAVSAKAGSGGVVDLKFSLTTRPKVGEPFDMEVALTPSVELQTLFARFQVADGLQLVSGAETEHLEHPGAGVAVGHKLTIIPKADGIFYVTAVVLADSDKESVARSFNIPIIAGQGLEELPAAPPAANVSDPQRAPARP